jgi:phage-related minor tail protein
MFGLAGEAGDEAILPLERIGGKLGVNAVGGDGGTYNITIQAIDTQTGAQFLQRNSQQIINQLRSADRLNRGYGNVR